MTYLPASKLQEQTSFTNKILSEQHKLASSQISPSPELLYRFPGHIFSVCHGKQQSFIHVAGPLRILTEKVMFTADAILTHSYLFKNIKIVQKMRNQFTEIIYKNATVHRRNLIVRLQSIGVF